ncbi:hypothetical protein pEaSNUABM5_00050 [Erwinia phage pEa_SNUABM_5]|uniref:Uncharacterized protein n=1 Tax=Erwinia phage pEa_SNUABM_5 TaxID=2797313 RepID=A0A7T8EPX6_9CAUD|nr:hypothetical protein MPK73_gp050 [Erwinia phage pEa_SNUABM_5]QQO90192.1 hypothetical protein pEaSNUABM5_00050 [Erwinia phage pEa_SNUABM_5]
MLEQVAVNTHIETVERCALLYTDGYIRCIRANNTVDQWLFHVSEIRRLEIQRNPVGHLRIRLILMGGCEEFFTPTVDKSEHENIVLIAISLLALRDYELALDEQTYSERTFDVIEREF